MALGPRSRRALLIGRDPGRAKAEEDRRRKRLTAAVETERVAMMQETPGHQPTGDILRREETLSKQQVVERMRRNLDERWRDIARDRLDSESLFLDGDEILTTLPNEVLLAADHPENIRVTTLTMRDDRLSFVVVEQDRPGHDRWEMNEEQMLYAAVRDRSYLQYLTEHGHLRQKDAPILYAEIEAVRPRFGDVANAILALRQLDDIGLDPRARMCFLASLDKLAELGFRDNLLIRDQALHRLIYDEMGSWVRPMHSFTRHQRYWGGMPMSETYDDSLIVSLNDLSYRFGD